MSQGDPGCTQTESPAFDNRRPGEVTVNERLPLDTRYSRSTTSMFLLEDELQQLTGRRQRHSQARALRAMGIEHKIRPDGRVIVLRQHVEQVLGMRASQGKSDEVIPNWGAA